MTPASTSPRTDLSALVARLRALAEKATPGPWTAHTYRTVTDVAGPNARRQIVHWMGFDGNGIARRQNHANARYIAACDPQTILALCDALTSLAPPPEAETPKQDAKTAVYTATGPVERRNGFERTIVIADHDAAPPPRIFEAWMCGECFKREDEGHAEECRYRKAQP
jgi:hypothetical protein